MLSTDISKRISIMKLLCACMVVFIHSQFVGDSFVHKWLREFWMYGVCRIAVPFFFIVSGYFLAKHMNEPNWWFVAIKKRLVGLLLPYVIWVGLFIVVSYLVFYTKGCLELSSKSFLRDIGADLKMLPLLVPLWYVRALLVLILFSPVICFAIKLNRTIGVGWLFLVGGVCFLFRPYSDCSHSAWYYFFNYGLSLEGVLYFSTGIFLRKYPINEPSKLVGFACLLLGVVLFAVRTWLLVHTDCQWRACQVGFFAIPFLLIGIFRFIPPVDMPKLLVNVSFPIYVCHLFFLAAVGGRLSRGGGGWYDAPPTINLWMLRAIFAVLMSVGVSWILNRYSPRISRFVFGGRADCRRG